MASVAEVVLVDLDIDVVAVRAAVVGAAHVAEVALGIHMPMVGNGDLEAHGNLHVALVIGHFGPARKYTSTTINIVNSCISGQNRAGKSAILGHIWSFPYR